VDVGCAREDPRCDLGAAGAGEQDEFSLDDFFVKVFPNLMAHATPQKERATAIHFLMKELNRLEDDDIEDVMLRDGVIHFVKPPSS
jgi:hypothetical protein